MEFVQNDLCFEVINESEKTVQVKGTQALVDAEPRDIIVPATVKNNDVEYTVVAVDGTFSFHGNIKYWKEDSRRSGGGLWMDDIRTHSVDGFAYTKIKSITLPDTLTSIGIAAFKECKSLRFITIPKSVTSVGYKAFYDCSNLMSITVLPEDIMIGEEVFNGTQWWKNQPDGFVYLGKILLGFKQSWSLYRSDIRSAIDVKEGTTSIAADVFYKCYNMPAVNLPKSLKCIGRSAFIGCEKLTSISIPSSIIRMGGNIFSNDYLKTLILTADGIEEYCKSGINEQLEKSSTRSRILKIKDEEVTEVVIPDTVTSILPYAFARIPSITSVKIPNSVTTIEDSAFKNCKALTSINIPDSVTTIGAYALKDCDTLTSITIPYSVTTIGKGALGGCDKLDTIIIENTPENITFDFANGSDDNWISKAQFVGQPENVEQLKAAAAARVASAAQKAAPKEAAAPAETPTAEPTPAPTNPVAAQPAETPKPAAPTINLDTLIAAALVDGIVTDKERAILCKKVKEAGGDVDEFEMLLDARIYEAQQNNQPAPAPKAEPAAEPTPKPIVEATPAPAPVAEAQPVPAAPAPVPAAAAAPAATTSAEGQMTIAQLAADFKNQFGSVLRVYNGRSKADDSLTLQEVGLTGNIAQPFDGNQKVGDFIAQMKTIGLKVKVYTCDEWIACIDGLTLSATGKVTKYACKADMEKML